jgi:hypothetical protein
MRKIIPLIVIFILSSCSTPSQVYWDNKVKELCYKDAGVTVFEHVKLNIDEYNRNNGENGYIVPPVEISSQAQYYDYLTRVITTVIHERSPRVIRSEYVVYRKLDNKNLGKMVTYTRSGGDIPTGISEGTSYSCKAIKNISRDLERQIFSLDKGH